MGKKRNLEGLGHTLASLEAQAPRIKGDERGIGLCLQREWDRGRAHSLAALGAQAPQLKGAKGGLGIACRENGIGGGLTPSLRSGHRLHGSRGTKGGRKGDEREPKGGLEGQGGIRKDKNLRL